MERKYIFLIIVFSFLSCTRRGENQETFLKIKGSDTEVNIVQQIAESFMEEHDSLYIAVTGGGSGTGIASLINQTADIANSSRPMSSKEMELARKQGVKPRNIVIGMDALAVIVHESNPIDSISQQSLKEIFGGNIQSWEKLGWNKGSLSAYGRQSNSGTFIFFRNTIIKGEYGSHVKRMNGNAQIVEAIRQDPTSIGYVGIGYVLNKNDKVMDGLKILSVSSEKRPDNYISPVIKENITSGQYVLTRPLYQYVDGTPTGLKREFILYELSPEGQKIVEKTGYYRVIPKYQAHNEKLLHEKQISER